MNDWPRCADCKSRLGRGYYISYDDFNRLLSGASVQPDEIVYCPKCGNLAVNWDENLMFYKEDKS